MSDPRVLRMARTLVRYSAEVKKGDVVKITGGGEAAPLIREVFRECVHRGAHPYVQVGVPGLDEIFLKEASPEQVRFVQPVSLFEIKRVDVLIHILSEVNTKRLTGIDPARQALAQQARKPIMDVFMRRAARHERGKGGLRWTLTLWPTQAYAQDAEMSLAEYTDFVLRACFAHRADPIAEWKKLSAVQRRVIRYLKGRKTVHIGGPDTDLELGIAGRTFINCEGRRNFPDGEVFTGPQERSVKGHIRYTFPACYGGREVDGIRLRFEKGEVVEMSAEKNEGFLRRMIGMDAGARRVGEFAFATNWGIRRFTKNILFDEKIGGTVHLALGKGYPESGSRNDSALHWDMICDLRKGGEVYVDGRLFTLSSEGARLA
ncbi:MAG: aminopeptidase, partial [Nitrospinota bacterium]